MLLGQNTQSGNIVVWLGFFDDRTCEHCCRTCSLNVRNPSWISGRLKGNDKKCVKGCFLRKLSTRTSTLVTADDTADLLAAVITVSNREAKKISWVYVNVMIVTLFIQTYLSFDPLFRDADRCLRVKFKTLACLPLFPNDISVEKSRQQHNLNYSWSK